MNNNIIFSFPENKKFAHHLANKLHETTPQRASQRRFWKTIDRY